MKKLFKIQSNIALLLLSIMFLNSCASSTMITSLPSGAKLYINDELVGETPYKYSDTKIIGSNNHVRIEKEGYQSFQTSFARDEQVDIGAIVGGVLVLVPFLWTMKYNDTHKYELLPLVTTSASSEKNSLIPITANKASKLRELKQLLDDKIITSEEFEKEKKKILDADN
jgi:hypothetical protein